MTRLKFLALISIFLAVLVWIGGFIIFQKQILCYPQNQCAKTDAIVVLTGGRNRLSEAMRLYNEDFAPLLIISGVAHDTTLAQIEQENKTKIVKNNQTVVLGNEATNTIENAIEVSEVIRRNNISSIRLVTSYYHMPRSMAEISARNSDLTIIPHVVFSQNVSLEWWKKPSSFYLVASEYNKFMFIYLKNFYLKLKNKDGNR